MRHAWIKFFLVLALVFLLLFIFRFPILHNMSSFLMVSAPIEKSDAIVVLGGDDGERVYYVCQLYKQGFSPKIIMSGGPLGWNLTYAQNMRDEAKYFGVPAKAIILETHSLSTKENAEFVLAKLVKMRASKIILVSSPYHMRRALMVFRKVFSGSGIEIIPAPALTSKYSDYNPHRWWTRHEDTEFVILEYIKLLEYAWKRYI